MNPTITQTSSTGRCPIRDEGHRCKKQIGHEGPHSAFGHQWKSGVVIIKKEKA